MRHTLLLVALALHATTAFEGLVQPRLPLRVVWFNETNCSGHSVGPGGPHYEAGRYSICVYNDAKVPLPDDTEVYGPGETECTEEQQTTDPFMCLSYHGMYRENFGMWYMAGDISTEIRWGGGEYARFGVPKPYPDPPTPIHYNDGKPASIGNGEVLEIVPSPPHTARVRFVRGWPGTLSSSGMPTTDGRLYSHYSAIALIPLEKMPAVFASVGQYGTGLLRGYMTAKIFSATDTHITTYSTVFGSDMALARGVNNTINYRYRTTNKAATYPENVEYLGEGKVLELGDEFELTPGAKPDFMVPSMGKKYYQAETFGTPGPRVFGMVNNLATESETINDSIFFIDAKVCADGRVQPGSIPCSDDCDGMKTYYATYCCEGSDAVNTDVEVTSKEWCTHLRRMYKQECKCAA